MGRNGGDSRGSGSCEQSGELYEDFMRLLKGSYEASPWIPLGSHKDFMFIHTKYTRILERFEEMLTPPALKLGCVRWLRGPLLLAVPHQPQMGSHLPFP